MRPGEPVGPGVLGSVVLAGLDGFVANLDNGLDAMRVDRDLLVEMDHVCYRVASDERYAELTAALGREAMLLGEHPVGGRLIATFRLPEPAIAGRWRISYLELPAPKPGSPYAEGLEHAELVVLGGDLDRFRARHAHLEPYFALTGLDKALNPELGLKVADLGLSVKFHRLSLGEVVRIEAQFG